MSIRNFVRLGTSHEICREPWLMKNHGLVCASNGLLIVGKKPESHEKWPQATPDVVKAFAPLLDMEPKDVITVNAAKLRRWSGKPTITDRWDNAYPGMKAGILNGVRINKCWLSLLLKIVDEKTIEIGRGEQTTGECVTIRGERWNILIMGLMANDLEREKKHPLPVFAE